MQWLRIGWRMACWLFSQQANLQPIRSLLSWSQHNRNLLAAQELTTVSACTSFPQALKTPSRSKLYTTMFIQIFKEYFLLILPTWLLERFEPLLILINALKPAHNLDNCGRIFRISRSYLKCHNLFFFLRCRSQAMA